MMEVELELSIGESDVIQVMEKTIELARKAKELGFSIKELEIETEETEEDEEDEEYEVASLAVRKSFQC
jgi:hypothetical protein